MALVKFTSATLTEQKYLRLRFRRLHVLYLGVLLQKIDHLFVEELAPYLRNSVPLFKFFRELVRCHLILLRERVDARVYFLGLDADAFLGRNFLKHEARLHALASGVVR